MATENVKIVISAFNKTQEAFNKVTSGLRKVSSASSRMAKDISVAATAATAAVAGMGFALSQQTQKIDNVAKTARKLGTSVATLQELQYAAEISGVSTSTLDMAMQRLTRRVSEAASGFGEAKGALRELGVNAAKLEKMPLDKQMEVLADAFQDVESEADKVRLAMKLFDSEGVALVNTLGIGSEGLREMAAEANRLGIVLTDIEAARFEEMNDQITRMKFSASAAATDRRAHV
jgi:chromosome segregation ATPase